MAKLTVLYEWGTIVKELEFRGKKYYYSTLDDFSEPTKFNVPLHIQLSDILVKEIEEYGITLTSLSDLDYGGEIDILHVMHFLNEIE